MIKQTFKDWLINNYNNIENSKQYIKILSLDFSKFVDFLKTDDNIKIKTISKNNIKSLLNILLWLKYKKITDDNFFDRLPKCKCGKYCAFNNVIYNMKRFGIPVSKTCGDVSCSYIERGNDLSKIKQNWPHDKKQQVSKRIKIGLENSPYKILKINNHKSTRNKNTIKNREHYFKLHDCIILDYNGEYFTGWCNKCKQEFQIPNQLINSNRDYNIHNITPCLNCLPKNSSISGQEKKLDEYVQSLGFNTIKYKLNIKHKPEIDIYIPELKIGFEFNGLLYHSDHPIKGRKISSYHINKKQQAFNEGIELIHIWGDDFTKRGKIVKSMIKNKLGRTPNKIHARKCTIHEMSSKDCTQFLNTNHLQGAIGAQHKYGLYHQGELVSLLTVSSKGEIKRFCSKLDTNVVGGFSKLFKHCKHLIVYTYADLDWCSLDPTRNVYGKYFGECVQTVPGYWWIVDNHKQNRVNFQKHKLVQMGWGTEEQTEDEIMYSKGYYKIYNCGNLKYFI